MNSQQLPMSFIKRVHQVMKSLFYVQAKLACNYDTRYDSHVTQDKSALMLDILNGDDSLALEGICHAFQKARILHEVKGTQIEINFKKNDA